MKDTIKAIDGYSIIKVIKNNDNFVIEKSDEVVPSELFSYYNTVNFDMSKDHYIVIDGNKVVLIAEYMSYLEYLEDYLYNDAHKFCAKFTTITGQELIYFRNEKLDVDYITKI